MSKKRVDIIQSFQESKNYKRALEAAKNDSEKAIISAVAEGFVRSFASILQPVIDLAQNDNEFAQQLGRALIDRSSVVTTVDSNVSSSLS